MDNEEEHARIVHQLRSAGWERWEAIVEADRLMSERITRREDDAALLAQPSGAQ